MSAHIANRAPRDNVTKIASEVTAMNAPRAILANVRPVRKNQPISIDNGRSNPIPTRLGFVSRSPHTKIEDKNIKSCGDHLKRTSRINSPHTSDDTPNQEYYPKLSRTGWALQTPANAPNGEKYKYSTGTDEPCHSCTRASLPNRCNGVERNR